MTTTLSKQGASGYHRGHLMRYDEADEVWRYADTGQPVPENPERACALCGVEARGGVDPCLGRLPGVSNACCGHGNPSEAYIQFASGVTVRGFDRIEADASGNEGGG